MPSNMKKVIDNDSEEFFYMYNNEITHIWKWSDIENLIWSKQNNILSK